MAYKIEFSEYVVKDLKRCSSKDQAFILDKILQQLAINPFPRGKTIKKLQGKAQAIYRLRVNASQSYRVFFVIFEASVRVLRVAPKKDADAIIQRL